MTKFYKSVDELKLSISEIKKNDSRQDTTLAVHSSLISNRQQAEWELDKKTELLEAASVKNTDDIHLLMTFLQPK